MYAQVKFYNIVPCFMIKSILYMKRIYVKQILKVGSGCHIPELVFNNVIVGLF